MLSIVLREFAIAPEAASHSLHTDNLPSVFSHILHPAMTWQQAATGFDVDIDHDVLLQRFVDVKLGRPVSRRHDGI